MAETSGKERTAGHTPLPWEHKADANRVVCKDNLRANDGWIVASCTGPDAESNAALIVKAVNSFPANLATLAKFVRIFESDDPFDRDMLPLVKEAMSEARSALSEAERAEDKGGE